ncbi:hypothetical protein N7447_004537 [Penicillium robsamsonii]|uniref:uncharacterized protein n=1 Tax=Penicillium robsamsonii TaxID=1792511 RepID=UPI00254918E5|nr:uncharacterized protein N7447_004537 [Penicillium robsamsonii]KAJ5827774.1 hypothetical protein N7447_004537 [Penicillium robsamsonii]
MSQSQFSDFASSFYGELNSQVPTPSVSIQTQEPWESSFLRPGGLTPTPVPSSLTRVSPDPIAALTRDALSFPVTGAGVKRLFNTARDICHYRRGRMKSKTIKDLMMFLCTSRFNIEEHEAKLLKEYFTWDEIEAAKEEKEGKIDLMEDNLISDTEE